MKKDLPKNIVERVYIAVVLEGETPTTKMWNVYLINEKQQALNHVLITSKGYGMVNDENVKTSILRHFIGDVEAHTVAKIEAIDTAVFGLTNEYWLSFYVDGTIYDKKYIFLPDSITDENIIKIPLVNKPGVLIGDTQ